MPLNLLHKSSLTPHVLLHHVASPLFRDPRSAGRISQKVGWLPNLQYKMTIEMLLRISSDDGFENLGVGHIGPDIDPRPALPHRSKFCLLSEDHEKGAKQRGAEGRVE